MLLVTLGVAIVIENALLYAFRADTRTIDVPYAFQTIDFGFTFLAVPRVVGFVAVFGVALALWMIMTFTDTGRAIRAVAREKLGAQLAGIDVAHIYAVTFGLGTACVAIAACLLIPTYYVNPRVGDAFVLVAFTIVVLGGMGSVPGALVGALLIGVAESLSGATKWLVRSARMRAFLPIAAVFVVMAAVPLVVHSNVTLNFLVVALMIALAGQGWNILGGYGGQYSFGHAAFFGTGAYVTAILQMRYGINAWFGFAMGIAAGAALGGALGALVFRSGLRGSYFALVTLAFAEVLRIIASVAPITGAGVGTLIKLDLGIRTLQFQSRAAFYWIILALVGISLVIARLIERSRFGAWLIAVRENEDAARALGVDASTVKTVAMVISAAITAAAGCFYAQYFLFVDSSIAYGTWISVEALLTPIIGGVGTVFGPLLGALVVKTLSEGAKLLAGDAPGLDLIIYGAVLVLVIWIMPRGLIGGLSNVRKLLARSGTKTVPAGKARHG
jgi:branched-chain amino acid transport system permease protein